MGQIPSRGRDVITVYQTPAAWNIPNISPFCTKLETYLRLAGLPYKTAPGDPRKAPTGKVPYIELDGELIGDSERIIAALKRKFGDRVDGHLSAAERARGHLIRRMLEEGTYFVLTHSRWGDDAGWQAYRPIFLAFFPPGIGRILVPIIRRDMVKTAHRQGTGRHPPAVIQDLGKADFDAVAAELGDKPFLLGEQPSSVDAVVYAFTTGILAFPVDSALKRHVAGLANLVAHSERMTRRCFPPERPPGDGGQGGSPGPG